jgi:hypothetical protein
MAVSDERCGAGNVKPVAIGTSASAKPIPLAMRAVPMWALITVVLVLAVGAFSYADAHGNALSAQESYQVAALGDGPAIPCDDHDQAPSDDGCCMVSASCISYLPATTQLFAVPSAVSKTTPRLPAHALAASILDLLPRPPKLSVRA